MQSLEIYFKSDIKYCAHFLFEYTINGDELTMAGYVRKRTCFALTAKFARTEKK